MEEILNLWKVRAFIRVNPRANKTKNMNYVLKMCNIKYIKFNVKVSF